MHCNAFLIAGVLISTVVFAPSAAPSALPFAGSGAWRGTEVAERHAPGEAADASWEVCGEWGKLESRVNRPPAVHRAAVAWTALAEAMIPGEALPLSASAVQLEAGLDADCRVEVFAWQGEPADSDALPAHAVFLVGAALRSDDAAGAIAHSSAAWKVPPPADPAAPSSELHVRAVVTHRGNTLTLTRSFVWSAGPFIPAD